MKSTRTAQLAIARVLGAAALFGCAIYSSGCAPGQEDAVSNSPAQSSFDQSEASASLSTETSVSEAPRAHILPAHPYGAASSCTPSTSNMTNTGPGPVMHAVRAHLIYWLPAGTHFEVGGDASSDATYEYLLQRFFGDIGSTALFQMLSQYKDSTGSPTSVTLGGTYTYTAAYPNGKGTTSNPLRNADIQNAVSAVIDTPGVGWTASTNDMFFVYTGANIQSCLSSDFSTCTFSTILPNGTANSVYGAYHSAYGHNNATVVYANMPSAASIGYFTYASVYPNDPKADPTITASSHELIEAIVDPLLNAWKGPAGNCDEIGDKCNLQMGPAVNFDGSNLVLPNGDRYLVQQEWSNAAATAGGASAGCTMGLPPPTAPSCAPSSTCDSEYFPPGYGSPIGYHTIETVTVACKSTPSVVQQQLPNGTWASLGAFVGNAGYPGTKTANVFDIGTQSQGTTTSGAAIGSIQKVRACTISTGGTTCDSQSTVAIADCCQPLTCGGSCGTLSDGCGGTLDCGACCTTPQCLCEDKGGVWTGKSCFICHTAACACGQAGGSWNGHTCS